MHTTLHLSDLSSSGSYTTKPLVVLKLLNRLLTLNLKLCALSAIPKSKWNEKGVPDDVDFNSR